MARLFGIISLNVGGIIQQAKGHFDIDLGTPKREAVTGTDNSIHGFTETPKPGMISGTITDLKEISLAELFKATDITVTLDTSQKTYALTGQTAYTGDGTVNTEAGEVTVEWSGDIEEIS